ncbi:MAG: RNA polymerase sigma factor [Alteromonadaceae bacterium]|nr:RNA polymerase sigma factor [Alteromonadaceae bacterium]
MAANAIQMESTELNDVEFASIDDFLISVEKKGYRIALLGVGQHADAIDILQDAMLKLVTNYSEKPANEWKPLFYRILHNRVTDWQRQQKLKNMFFFWRQDSEDEADIFDNISDEKTLDPIQAIGKSALQKDVVAELEKLPLKQQQCFLLRTWEGMSVKETAVVMQCSEGSVKTHFFRAVQKLKSVLGESHDIKI